MSSRARRSNRPIAPIAWLTGIIVLGPAYPAASQVVHGPQQYYLALGDSITLATRPCLWTEFGEQLHDAFTGRQLDAALSFLRAHPGEVSPLRSRSGETTFANSRPGVKATRPASKTARSSSSTT
jgi:hypothetical protein